MSTPEAPLGYHVIAGEDLLDSLRRCASGEAPDAVYAELWANADHEQVPGSEAKEADRG